MNKSVWWFGSDTNRQLFVSLAQDMTTESVSENPLTSEVSVVNQSDGVAQLAQDLGGMRRN